jgi:chloramphenicol 3-O phosphotransferase
MAKVILLNGVGSVGKSSIAKALQDVATQPFLHVEMDAFLAMMPQRYFEHPEGLSFEQSIEHGNVTTFAKTGPIAKRALSGMRHAIAEMANAGNNLIVDEVLFGNTDNGSVDALSKYQTLLEPFEFYMVGVFAPLEILEERERMRGDRVVGLSRWQYERVHEGMNYDLSIHTEDTSPKECAELIKAKFSL